MKAQEQKRYQFQLTETEYLTLVGLVLAGQEASGHESAAVARIVEEFAAYADVTDEPRDATADDAEVPDASEEGFMETLEPAPEALNGAKRERRPFLRRRTG